MFVYLGMFLDKIILNIFVWMGIGIVVGKCKGLKIFIWKIYIGLYSVCVKGFKCYFFGFSFGVSVVYRKFKDWY